MYNVAESIKDNIEYCDPVFLFINLNIHLYRTLVKL